MQIITITTGQRTGSKQDVIGTYVATSTAPGSATASGDGYLKNTNGGSYCGPSRGGGCDWDAFYVWAIADAKSYFQYKEGDKVILNGKEVLPPAPQPAPCNTGAITLQNLEVPCCEGYTPDPYGSKCVKKGTPLTPDPNPPAQNCAKEGEVRPLFGDCCPGTESKFDPFKLRDVCVKPTAPPAQPPSTCAKEGEKRPIFGECCTGLESKFDPFKLGDVCVKPAAPVTASIEISKSEFALGDIMSIKTCAPDGYMYVLDPSGKETFKGDIPKGGCRDDSYTVKADHPSGTYTVKVADYSNKTQAEKTYKVLAPGQTGTGKGCPEGTTRVVKCPKNGKDVTQKCVNGTWVNLDENACKDDYTAILIAAVIAVIVLIFIFRMRK